MKQRIQGIRELEEEARRIHYSLTNGKEVLRLDYQQLMTRLKNPRGR